MMQIDLTSAILLVLATYRLAQIVAQDVISEPIRRWVDRHGTRTRDVAMEEFLPDGRIRPGSWVEGLRITRQWPNEQGTVTVQYLARAWGWLSYLLNCVVCVSVWAGLGLAGLWLWGGIAGQWLVMALAASGGAVVAGSVLAAMNTNRGGNK